MPTVADEMCASTFAWMSFRARATAIAAAPPENPIAAATDAAPPVAVMVAVSCAVSEMAWPPLPRTWMPAPRLPEM